MATRNEIEFLKREVNTLKCSLIALSKSLENLWSQIYIYYQIFVNEEEDIKKISKENFPIEDFDVNVAIIWNGLKLKYTYMTPEEGEYTLDFGLEEDTEVMVVLNRKTEVEDRLEAWWNKKRVP